MEKSLILLQIFFETTEDAFDVADKVAEETNKRYTHKEMLA